MLHILWLIIKCTGSILAFLLAVLFLAAALVLFCPLRYRAKARKEAKEWECFARVGWLFGLVSVTVLKGSGDSCTQIRLFGIKSSTWKKIFTRKRRPEKKKKPAGQEPEKEKPEKKPAQKQLADKRQPEGYQPKETEAASENAEEDIREEGFYKSQKAFFFKGLWQRIVEKCKSIRNTFRKMISGIRNLHSKIGLWRDFLGKPQTKTAFGLGWQQLLAVLRHVGPQKWKGFVNLGLGDPGATGQALAVLGAAYPIYGGSLAINPVWDRKVLEGNLCVKGRVYGAVLLYRACRLYFNQDVKGAFQWIMRQASGESS